MATVLMAATQLRFNSGDGRGSSGNESNVRLWGVEHGIMENYNNGRMHSTSGKDNYARI
jgi:hypothetical protein